jgi:hypothetical protein
LSTSRPPPRFILRVRQPTASFKNNIDSSSLCILFVVPQPARPASSTCKGPHSAAPPHTHTPAPAGPPGHRPTIDQRPVESPADFATKFQCRLTSTSLTDLPPPRKSSLLSYPTPPEPYPICNFWISRAKTPNCRTGPLAYLVARCTFILLWALPARRQGCTIRPARRSGESCALDLSCCILWGHLIYLGRHPSPRARLPRAIVGWRRAHWPAVIGQRKRIRGAHNEWARNGFADQRPKKKETSPFNNSRRCCRRAPAFVSRHQRQGTNKIGGGLTLPLEGLQQPVPPASIATTRAHAHSAARYKHLPRQEQASDRRACASFATRRPPKVSPNPDIVVAPRRASHPLSLQHGCSHTSAPNHGTRFVGL